MSWSIITVELNISSSQMFTYLTNRPRLAMSGPPPMLENHWANGTLFQSQCGAFKSLYYHECHVAPPFPFFNV